MRLKRRVSLNNIQLDELDERIAITGVEETEANETLEAESTQARAGQRITRNRRNYLDVTVRFGMDIPKTKLTERSQLLEKVKAWAQAGGYLRLNYKPGRWLHVILAQASGEGDLFRWTDDFTLVFRAYRVPYWNEATPAEAVSAISSNSSFSVDVGGNTETVAEFTVENMSGALIKNVTLKIGSSEMKFSDSNLLPGSSSLVISHGGNVNGLFFLRAMVGNTSMLKARSGANDFYVNPGANTVTFTADRAVRVRVSVRGRFQ